MGGSDAGDMADEIALPVEWLDGRRDDEGHAFRHEFYILCFLQIWKDAMRQMSCFELKRPTIKVFHKLVRRGKSRNG